MKKTALKIVLLILTIAIVVVGMDYFQKLSPATNTQTAPKTIENISQSSPTNIDAPKIDRTRLMSHLNALVGERYTESDRIPAREYIAQQLEAAGYSPIQQTFENGINIFAEKPGTDPEAGAILIAAHYDTVSGSPGADDNASGVAVVLEVARLLGSLSTPRSLQVAFFDLEESGLLGSLSFVGNPDQLDNLQAAIILDMVGYACRTPGCQQYPQGIGVERLLKATGIPSPDKGEFLAVVGDIEHLPLLTAFRQISQENLPPILTLPVPLKGILMPDLLRSDHAPFWYKGIGAVLVTDTANLRSPHYHQPSDTIENIDREFFFGAAEIVLKATNTLLKSRENLGTEATQE